LVGRSPRIAAFQISCCTSRSECQPGFTVQADASIGEKGKTPLVPAGTFSWRIVAKRKDIQGERFERVTIPAAVVLPPSTPPVAGDRD